MQTEIRPTEGVPIGIDSDGERWSDEKERKMNTYPSSVNLDADGLKYPEDPNPTVPEKKLPDWKPYSQLQGFWQ